MRDRINIVYEDKYIIVVNKPSHLLTISTLKEKEKTMYHKVLEYEKKKNKNNKIFIVHRLDKDTSGLIVFAKDEKTKEFLQNNWNEFKRKYIAVVEGKVDKEGEIRSYLTEGKNLITYSTTKEKGKLAITKYKRLNFSKSFSLLDIEILTGRKNQIRVHMKDNKTPIIGDKKYGAKTNPLRKLGLIAYYLEIVHPKSKKTITFNIEIPKEFSKMFSQK